MNPGLFQDSANWRASVAAPRTPTGLILPDSYFESAHPEPLVYISSTFISKGGYSTWLEIASALSMKTIKIRGARTHNLANIDLDLPRDKLIVVTGLSGSGKSSLAFDTIYAEGQRRYVESLSAYARQFLSVMEKPDIDHIEGLSPAISIEQKSTSHNPRSTVGTITEIYDYLRLLWGACGYTLLP